MFFHDPKPQISCYCDCLFSRSQIMTAILLCFAPFPLCVTVLDLSHSV
uniref:Uncharacterized protein n=1 Tax=Anguilla anguilla TaxID=7936 RepID=A0A0E9WPV2_ANGAN